MVNNFSTAGAFFDRAGAFQAQAASEQRQRADAQSDDAEINPYRRSLSIGAVPPDVNQPEEEQSDLNDYVSEVKEDLLARAREKRRPSNGDTAMRASGGINYAVKR